MAATAPVPRVARCQMPIKATISTTDTIAARKRREEVISLSPPASEATGSGWSNASRADARNPTSPRTRGEVKKQNPSPSRRLPDLEAVEIILWLGRIEGLAHHRERLVGR